MLPGIANNTKVFFRTIFLVSRIKNKKLYTTHIMSFFNFFFCTSINLSILDFCLADMTYLSINNNTENFRFYKI